MFYENGVQAGYVGEDVESILGKLLLVTSYDPKFPLCFKYYYIVKNSCPWLWSLFYAIWDVLSSYGVFAGPLYLVLKLLAKTLWYFLIWCITACSGQSCLLFQFLIMHENEIWFSQPLCKWLGDAAQNSLPSPGPWKFWCIGERPSHTYQKRIVEPFYTLQNCKNGVLVLENDWLGIMTIGLKPTLKKAKTIVEKK